MENSWCRIIRKCSTTGPSVSAGKKVSAPTIRTTPTSRPTNKGPFVGKVPADAGITFLLARLPATASSGMIMRKRPISIAIPTVMLNHGVLAFSPINALPLFPVALVYA